jgi:hypothetical protein
VSGSASLGCLGFIVLRCIDSPVLGALVHRGFMRKDDGGGRSSDWGESGRDILVILREGRHTRRKAVK